MRRKKVKKNLEYYLNLNYPTEIIRIPEQEGGGYLAYIPLLGKNVVRADGDTVEEAFANLENIKKEWFEIFIARGTSIPEPQMQNELSGKLLLRIPKQLHSTLDFNAKINETSLNQYIQFLLASAVTANSFSNLIDSYCNKLNTLFENYQNVDYNFEGNFSTKKDEFEKPGKSKLALYSKTA